jgi:hypothetical protein
MQIQSWEGAALSRAETVLQGTTHDTVRAEIGYGEKVSQRLWSKKVLAGRANVECQRVLYCADQEKTATAEVRPPLGYYVQSAK